MTIESKRVVLPIDNSFLYVEPIYIQASQASMPQLKKVALAMGNRLAYADTYEQALSQLIGSLGGTRGRADTGGRGRRDCLGARAARPARCHFVRGWFPRSGDVPARASCGTCDGSISIALAICNVNTITRLQWPSVSESFRSSAPPKASRVSS